MATAAPAALPALRAEIGTAIAAITAAAQQARASVSGAEAARALAETSSASRTAVASVMNGMGDFKLTFASQADEDAYRQREAELRAYIERQQARHTPEGDLNAAGGAVGQMADAKAHGAGDDPRFQQRWNALVETTGKLRAEVARSGGSTKEFDDRLRADLRAILKSKGLSDAQIDAQFAVHSDPLEATKAFVADKDLASVRHEVERRVVQSDQAYVVEATTPPSALSADNPFAKLRAAGVTASDHDMSAGYSSGVTITANKPTPMRS